MPSTGGTFAHEELWKVRTAALVRGPNLPSITSGVWVAGFRDRFR